MPNPTNTEAELREHNEYDALLTKVLMKEHPKWSMEVIREAALICSNTLIPVVKAHTAKAVEEAEKKGFYAGQAVAGVELERCHQNWKRWNAPDEVKTKL